MWQYLNVVICRLVILFIALFGVNLVLAIFHYRLNSYRNAEHDEQNALLMEEVLGIKFCSYHMFCFLYTSTCNVVDRRRGEPDGLSNTS